MTIEDIRRAVERSGSATLMADAFRAALGIESPRRRPTYREIPLSEYQRRQERKQVREAMMQRYGALDRP